MDKAARVPHPGLGYTQFVAIIAVLMAVSAVGTDAMLPALGQLAQDLGAAAGNQRQWVISAYLISTGVAQILYGTLADRFGRKPVLLWSITLYLAASLAAASCTSFSMMVLARIVMGIGGAGPRVLAISIVRDCYAGRLMAKVMSFTLMVFMAVPVLAPSLGQIIMFVADWRGIFLAFAAFAAFVLVWIARKLPETLHPEDRAMIEFSNILAAARATLRNRVALGYTLAVMVIMGCLFGFINSAQQIFAVVFHRPGLFPVSFACIAAAIACASLLNARIVNRYGSRLISHIALLGFIGIGTLHLAVAFTGHETILTFVALQAPLMFCFGLLGSNFNAMAMEPMGHIAGSAASILGFISMVGGALFGFLVGQCFNGTIVPLTAGFVIGGVAALAATLFAEDFRLFKARQKVIV